ncbi:MAG: ABC transporter ATP-binding protein [Planctomycetota bacterium]|nr:ABC transporter ATP-binding protein [Planctomycetota bacterium]
MSESSREHYKRFRVGDDVAPVSGETRPEETEKGRVKSDWSLRKTYLKRYFSWLWPYRGRIAAVFGLAVLAAILGLFLPYATKIIVDDLLLADDIDRAAKLSRLNRVGGLVVLLLVVQQGLESLRTYWMTVLNARVIFRLRQRLFDHFLEQPLHELGDMKIGGILSRLSGDIDQVTGLLQMAVITPGVATIRVVLTLSMLMWLNWRMAAVATALIPPIMVVNMVYIRKIRPLYRSMRKDRSDIDARVAETFAGIRVVRVFGREKKESHDYAVGHHTVIRKKILTEALQLVVTSGWGLLIPAASLIIIWYGGTRFIQDQMNAVNDPTTIGSIMAFQMYVFMLLHPVSQIVFSYGSTQRALAAMERTFFELAKPIDKPDRPGAVSFCRPLNELVFDNVSFEYRPDRPVLTDFSLTVRSGETVALVGPSGAGKTTVTNLVARFYDPKSGAIRINGTDLCDVKLSSYRRVLAMVQQEVFLFDGTVRDNIAFSRRDPTEDEVIAAARRANAHEFITAMPEGYDTVIGERGIKLSGGQRQRLSIARALLADPEILILDEATSNLDTESEQLIQASLLELLSGRTTFVIAHRLSTITHADKIVVLENGRIAESGNHETLMSARGKYHAMITRQMQLHSDAIAAADWK